MPLPEIVSPRESSSIGADPLRVAAGSRLAKPIAWRRPKDDLTAAGYRFEAAVVLALASGNPAKWTGLLPVRQLTS